jgi:Flp pilus assembly protein TadB
MSNGGAYHDGQRDAKLQAIEEWREDVTDSLRRIEERLRAQEVKGASIAAIISLLVSAGAILLRSLWGAK